MLRYFILSYVTPSPKESEFTELEKAFAEARRRSLAQGARAKAKTAKPAVAMKTSKPTVDPAAAAPVDKPPDADVASKPTTAAAAATSEAPPVMSHRSIPGVWPGSAETVI